MSTPKINLNKEIVALFSGQSSTVTTPKLYIQLTGSHSLAIVLNQAIFWSNKSSCKDGYFHKTYEEWFEEVHIPERTLRRRFDKLEQYGWIATKVKMVHGKNTKHVKPDMDKIIESISIMLNQDCPNRPESQESPNIEQKPCTKVAPSGQSGRSEPANLADSSIYTDDYDQIKTTNCESSSSFFFSETIDKDLLNQKLHRDERSDEEFMDQVVDHVENQSDKKYPRIVRAQGALKLLKKMKEKNELFYVKGKQPKETDAPKNHVKPEFSEEELALVGAYNHAKKMVDWGCKFEIYMPKQDDVKAAEAIIARMKAKEAPSCQPSTPKKNARRESLNSASSLVSHLNLSQRDS